MTPSEELVLQLTTRSFLTMWSYANPLRPNGNELCDVLVVFDSSIVIFSVKEIRLSREGDAETNAERWTRKAIDASIKQLLGARRSLTAMTRVIRADGSLGIDLPEVSRRRVHLVAVALGGERRVPIVAGQSSAAGYVHVLDEISLNALLGELDTASEFLAYFSAKESHGGTVDCGGEEDLLALYIAQNRRFPRSELLTAKNGFWAALQIRSEFLARKADDEISYWWDETIETLISDLDVATNELGQPANLRDMELVVRTMAAEPRYARRGLSIAFIDWLMRKQAGARNIRTDRNVGYVFATMPRDWTDKERIADLYGRCIVARSPEVLNTPVVIGLGTQVYDPAGYSFVTVRLDIPEWLSNHAELAQEIRSATGTMSRPELSSLSFSEFPDRR